VDEGGFKTGEQAMIHSGSVKRTGLGDEEAECRGGWTVRCGLWGVVNEPGQRRGRSSVRDTTIDGAFLRLYERGLGG